MGGAGVGETKREREPLYSSPRPLASFPIDGSTATVVLIVGNTLFLANCGDSAGERVGMCTCSVKVYLFVVAAECWVLAGSNHNNSDYSRIVVSMMK